MSTDSLHDLQVHALRRFQALAKADGFKRLPDEKVFMDDIYRGSRKSSSATASRF